MNRQIDAQAFRHRLRNLILLTWTIPPVFGLSFLLYINMFTPRQMLDILLSPIEPLFVLAWLLFSAWYLPRVVKPVTQYLEKSTSVSGAAVLDCMRRFPVYFWGLFILYLLMAPSSVMLSAIFYSDFIAAPIDWFRIHLVLSLIHI